MANILKNAIETLLLPQLMANAADLVTYARLTQTVDVLAVYGQKLLKTHDQFGGIKMEWTDLDFIIEASTLHFGDGILITPTRGDLITTVVASEHQTYEVLPFGNDPPWRWSDPYNLMYRIHTKHIDTDQFYL